jgi:hypothetical protein
MIRLFALLLTLPLISAAAPRGKIIFAGGGWAAVDRADSCEAITRSLRIAPRGKTQAIASFAFNADRSRWGEFRTRLSRPPRLGSNVMLTIGRQPFMLVTRAGFAWSRGTLQEQAMINAARVAGGMRVEARDAAGRRFSDHYRLDGAATAIDAAAARCAGKMAQR